jgi:hypothetical protein
MISRYLVNFGDSWASGAETKEHPVHSIGKKYAQQLSHLTNRMLIDVSQPSTSVHHMIHQFHQFIQNDHCADAEYIALFFVTAQERQMAFDDQCNPIEIQPQNNTYKNYYQQVYTHQLGEFNLNTTLLSLQSMCRHHGIDDRYILGWQYPNLWPEIDLTKFYKQGKVNCMNMLGSDDKDILSSEGNINFIHNDGHPSIHGHTKIAKELYHWIQG